MNQQAPDWIVKKVRDEEEFLTRHPEHVRYLGILLSTVTSCEKSGLAAPDIPLDAAHEHIYGKTDQSGCQYCKRNFEYAREQASKAYERGL